MHLEFTEEELHSLVKKVGYFTLSQKYQDEHK